MTFLLEQLYLHTCCRNDDSLEGTCGVFFFSFSVAILFLHMLPFPTDYSVCEREVFLATSSSSTSSSSSVPTSRRLFGTRL